MTDAPLKGLKVLDLSRVLAGPFCTQILGDMGAEIIKIERPGSGDDTRAWGPPYLQSDTGAPNMESAYYLSINRNKKSVAVDIAQTDGQEIIRKLAQQSDVLIENFKVGGLVKYGLDYDSLHKLNPKLVYASISGFGQTGPLATEPGYDFLAQGMAGLMAATGAKESEPTKCGIAISDILTGLYAAIGILGALESRRSTGKGQHVDVALIDCTLAAMTNISQYFLTSGHVAPKVGNAHSTIVPYQVFATLDGHIIIAVGNDGQFRRLCGLLSAPEWANDDRFKTNPARVANRETLVALIAGRMAARASEDWLAALRDVDVPCGPVNTMDKVFAEPQMVHRAMKINLPHPLSSNGVDLVGSPLRFSDNPVAYDAAPPMLGQHTEDVLRSIGYGDDIISTLAKNGAIGCDPISHAKMKAED
jgi:crotonobetainyl-CoA:carnitine CoA-transferase CaiB-like acyl-CoA transferase